MGLELSGAAKIEAAAVIASARFAVAGAAASVAIAGATHQLMG